ncbi:30S ribosomal protein S15 [Candidatus Berkelbacteria bacterium]|nr:30S ribosomal protein S15 [Candidatus Berkelbacteria bacterium]
MAKIVKKAKSVKSVKIAKKPAKAAPKKVAPKAVPKPIPLAKPAQKPAPKVAGPDTGSAHVQINFMTERIEELIKHLRAHPKDFDSKRGLLMIVGKRRRLLNYLARKEPGEYEKIIAKLKLAKTKAPTTTTT